MRHIGAIVWMLALVAVADADTMVVKGELSFSSKGIGKVLECKSGRTFTLGAMASNPYFSLVQRYWRLSNHGKTPVLIEVRGDISRTSNPETESTLQSPSVNALVAGRCSDTSPGSRAEQSRDS
jgi:hypothetical protein